MIPTGFRDATRAAQGGAINILYLAVGPRVHNETVNINVVRERSRGQQDIDTIATLELKGIRTVEPQSHGFSKVDALTVRGAPARSVDYLSTPTGTLLHLRQVFTVHGNWIYTITYTALPSTYQAHLQALDQVIRGWRWQ